MKNPFKKKLIPTPTAPRSLEDIKSEFSQLQFALGQQQYLVTLHRKRVAELQERMAQVDQEASARQELDAKIAAETAPKTETKDEANS